MKLTVRLKLALSKERKIIEIKYNTFEKATFDKYLCASIAKNAGSSAEAYNYIDDITGNGSLNSHFKGLYDEASQLSKEQLEAIMQSSMYPILKIDNSAWYDYFPELDISLFKNRIYKGDLASLSTVEIGNLLGINEIILEQQFVSKDNNKRAQPYEVEIDRDDNKVSVKIGTEYLNIDPNLFESVVIRELDSIDRYEGAIALSPEGEGWQMLTNSALSSLLSGNRFYYENGAHHLIRNRDVKKTVVAKIVGIYFFKETALQYEKNPKLCKKVIDFLTEKDELKFFKANDAIAIMENVDDVTKRDAINYYLERQDLPEIAKYGINLILSGIVIGWKNQVLSALLKYSRTQKELEAIYKIDSTVGFKLRQLILLDKTILTEEHLRFVEEYYADLEKKREAIKLIIGDVTTSGLREKAKDLKSDADTKKFSNLCNKLIGHVKNDIDKADGDELREWLKNAEELKKLAEIIKKKIAEEKPTE